MSSNVANRGAARPRLTLRAIAERLDLSTATVSLALRDSPLVAPATRARIKSTAREIGYVYNRSAASLRTQRSQIVGVAFYDIVNPYFAEMLAQIEDEMARRKHTILLSNHGEDLGRQAAFIETLLQYGADGLILCPATGTTATDVGAIRDAGLPVVLICRSVAGVHVDRVGSDDELGMRRATEHLVAQGHRRIAFIGGYDTVSTFSGRIEGYRRVLAEHGLGFDRALCRTGAPVRRFGRQVIDELLALDDPPTAAVCVNDMIASGVLMGLHKHGLEAGRDFGLVGYDDVEEAAHWTPSLSSVFNNQHEIGAAAARLLIERINHPDRDPVEMVLEPQLRIRQSSVAP